MMKQGEIETLARSASERVFPGIHSLALRAGIQGQFEGSPLEHLQE